jgi:alkanesulfonate monooxygenase SsuD/methylene tetrahydromethanopterin reductase-like flavin-dependent oxidoreductase (luciferase family)
MEIGLSGWSATSVRTNFGGLLHIMQKVDSLGFDSVWFNERHFSPETDPYPAPLILGAAILALTERLRFGCGVLVLPIHHPLLVAEELAQLDRQSGGRLDIGFGRGAGSARSDFKGFGAGASRKRFGVAIDLIVEAWARGNVGAVNGGKASGLALGTEPMLHTRPRVWIAALSKQTVELAVQRNLPLLLTSDTEQGAILEHYRGACLKLKRPCDVSHFSEVRHICIGATSEEAERAAEKLVLRLGQRREEFARERGGRPLPLDKSQLVGDGIAIVGDPASCVAQVRELAQSTGVGHMRLMFNAFGQLNERSEVDALELFAAEVLPKIRNA